jgi:DNA-binding transcriptional ArsR family regulator
VPASRTSPAPASSSLPRRGRARGPGPGRRRGRQRSPLPGVFRAIADPTRRAMLDRLLAGECAAGELSGCARPRMSQPALSQHLAVLRATDLVAQRRDGRRRLYRLNPEPLREIHDWIEHYRRFWDVRFEALGRYLDQERDREASRPRRDPRAAARDEAHTRATRAAKKDRRT